MISDRIWEHNISLVYCISLLPILECFKNFSISFDLLESSLKVELEVKMKSLITYAMGLYGYVGE